MGTKKNGYKCRECIAEQKLDGHKDVIYVSVFNRDTGRCVFRGNLCEDHRIEASIIKNYTVKLEKRRY